MSCKVRKRRACSVSSFWFCSMFEIEWERERESKGFESHLVSVISPIFHFYLSHRRTFFCTVFFPVNFPSDIAKSFGFSWVLGPSDHFDTLKITVFSSRSIFGVFLLCFLWIIGFFFKADLLLLRRLSKNWCRWSWIGPFCGD